MAQNKIFLDANVILEVLLDRKNNRKARELIINNAGNLHISALTVHIAVYFGQTELELKSIKLLLSDYYVEDLKNIDIDWAYNNLRNDDFEDALQIAIAIRCGCDVFATFDKNLYKTYQSLPSIKLLYLA